MREIRKLIAVDDTDVQEYLRQYFPFEQHGEHRLTLTQDPETKDITCECDCGDEIIIACSHEVLP